MRTSCELTYEIPKKQQQWLDSWTHLRSIFKSHFPANGAALLFKPVEWKLMLCLCLRAKKNQLDEGNSFLNETFQGRLQRVIPRQHHLNHSFLATSPRAQCAIREAKQKLILPNSDHCYRLIRRCLGLAANRQSASNHERRELTEANGNAKSCARCAEVTGVTRPSL